MHNWSDGDVQSTYPLGDYKSKFGTVCTYHFIHYFSLLSPRLFVDLFLRLFCMVLISTDRR